ncbi:MAG: hypothetical protein QXI64_10655 [Sulfolobales archaeon]
MRRALYILALVALGIFAGSLGGAIYRSISPPPGQVVVVHTVAQPNTSQQTPSPFLDEGVYIARRGDGGPSFERASNPPGAGDVVVFLQIDNCPGCWGPFVSDVLRGANAAGVERVYVVVCRSLYEAPNCSDPLALSIVKSHMQRVRLANGEEIEVPPAPPNLVVETKGAKLFSEYLAARLREDPAYASKPLWTAIADYIYRMRST